MSAELIVVIVTHNRPALFARTLKSLAGCHLPHNYARTIVVENGRRNGAEDIVRHADAPLKIGYLFEQSPSKSVSLNRAVEAVGNGLVVFFDDDVRLSPGVLSAYARAADGFHGGRYFVGPSEPDYEEPPPQWLKAYLPPSAVGIHADEATVRQLTFPGYNWAAFADDLKDCGGFRTDLGAGDMPPGEDSEMQKSLRGLGIEPCYVPGAMVWHYVPRERCSPAWTLHRVYRYAITLGMAEGRSYTKQRKRWGLARGLQRTLRKRMARSEVWAALALSRRGRFAVRYHWAYVRGFIRGYRIGAAQSPPEVDPPREPDAS